MGLPKALQSFGQPTKPHVSQWYACSLRVTTAQLLAPSRGQPSPTWLLLPKTHARGKNNTKKRKIPGRQAAEVPLGAGAGAAFSFSTQRLCSAAPPTPCCQGEEAGGCWFIYTPARQQGHFSKLSEFLSHLLTQRRFRIASFLPPEASCLLASGEAPAPAKLLALPRACFRQQRPTSIQRRANDKQMSARSPAALAYQAAACTKSRISCLPSA